MTNICEINYTVKAETAKQERILNSIDNSAYYEDKYINVVKGLFTFLKERHGTSDIIFQISEKVSIYETSVNHKITFFFEFIGINFKKKKVRDFVYKCFDDKLKEKGYYE